MKAHEPPTRAMASASLSPREAVATRAPRTSRATGCRSIALCNTRCSASPSLPRGSQREASSSTVFVISFLRKGAPHLSACAGGAQGPASTPLPPGEGRATRMP